MSGDLSVVRERDETVAGAGVTRPVAPPASPSRPAPLLTIDTAALTRFGIRAAIAIPVLVVLFLLYLFGASNLVEARSQHQLMQELQTTLPTGELDALDASVTPGSAVALLEIPALGLRQVVIEGSGPEDTKAGPGHVASSPIPGEFGNAVIVGRHRTYGAPFEDLDQLQAGEAIVVTTGQGVFRYTVDAVEPVVGPQSVVQPALESRITLITSTGVVGGSRLAVTGSLEGDPIGVASRPAVALDDASLGVGVDAVAYPLIALWIAILIGVVFAVRRTYRRWSGLAAYLVTAPIVLVVLWGTFETLARLLPATV